MTEATRQQAELPQYVPQRRSFFRWFTLMLGTVASGLAGVPVLGYLVRTKRLATMWVNLGPVEDFPIQQTRLITFDNPLGQPWDGMTARTGVFVRKAGQANSQAPKFRILAVNCASLGMRSHLVSRIRVVYVSMPWWRVLRGWPTSVWAAASWPLSMCVESAPRSIADQGAAFSNA